jgi:hypothetical protein
MGFGDMNAPMENEGEMKKEKARIYEAGDEGVMDIDTEMIEVDPEGW